MQLITIILNIVDNEHFPHYRKVILDNSVLLDTTALDHLHTV